MPSIVQELSGHRDLGGLRTVVECPFKATVLREGPAQDTGPGAAWLAYLCPVHVVDLDGWPGVADHADNGAMPCGVSQYARDVVATPRSMFCSGLSSPAAEASSTRATAVVPQAHGEPLHPLRAELAERGSNICPHL